MADEAGREAKEWNEDHGAVGIFKTWKGLYTTVAVYTVLTILILYVLSVTLDYSGS